MVKISLQTWNGLYCVLASAEGEGWRYILKNADRQTAEQLYNELREA